MDQPFTSEHSHSHDTHFASAPLLSAAALLGFALLMVGSLQVGKINTPTMPDAGAATIAQRQLRFNDQPNGSITVIDTQSGNLIYTVAPGTNGFLRGTLRGLARERKRESFDQSTPFVLSETQSRHLLLKDPATGRFVDLGSFGPTNAAVFANLLTAGTRDANVEAANPS